MATAAKLTPAGKYTGAFRWGRLGEANVSADFTRTEDGKWYCDAVNGVEWQYPTPAGDPFGNWGIQLAKPTALAALRAFLRQWDHCGRDGVNYADSAEYDPGDEAGTVCTTADMLTVEFAPGA